MRRDARRLRRFQLKRIFERLRDEHGYEGSYSTVRRFIKKHRQTQKETFIPLDHQPGQRMEADFGEIVVDFPEGRRKVNVLILVWSYSNAPFAMALPTQRTEAILEGMANIVSGSPQAVLLAIPVWLASMSLKAKASRE